METEKEEQREKKIQEILLSSPGGLTIEQIASAYGVSNPTMTKYLDIMVRDNQIYRRNIVSAKIHYHLKFARMFFGYKG